jgi:hypothetical protein
MMHHETLSPIEKAGSGKCTWRRSNKCTPRMAKSARKEVMANAPTDESTSRMQKLQTQMRSRLSLGNSAIHGCDGLLVGGATTYKRGMTTPESRSTATSSNHSTGSAEWKHLGTHLLTENRSL